MQGFQNFKGTGSDVCIVNLKYVNKFVCIWLEFYVKIIDYR